MSAIAVWWAIPIGATVLAMLWAAWASRTRGPGEVSDTTREYDKFRAAMERSESSLPKQTGPRRENTSRQRAGRLQRRPGS